MSYLQVVIWVMSVIYAIYTVIKLNKSIKESEEKIKKAYNTTDKQANILKKLLIDKEFILLTRYYRQNPG